MGERHDFLAGRIVEIQHGIVAEAVAIAIAHETKHECLPGIPGVGVGV